MQESEFQRLVAEGYNRIPVTLETYADLDTPLSIYLKLANRPNSFLLESVVGGERFGRYSFIGLAARTCLRATGFSTEVVCDGLVVERHEGNPLDFLEAYQARFKVHVPEGFPRFCGGLAGYFGYDAIRYVESRLADFNKRDEIGMPDVLLLQNNGGSACPARYRFITVSASGIAASPEFGTCSDLIYPTGDARGVTVAMPAFAGPGQRAAPRRRRRGGPSAEPAR